MFKACQTDYSYIQGRRGPNRWIGFVFGGLWWLIQKGLLAYWGVILICLLIGLSPFMFMCYLIDKVKQRW